ncbi:hypothetical protein HN924_01235 [Candidatus Woesearchaeota archaeon]|jgi:ribosomal protein L20A (L18A)|nr:hypothetical protein [Candidatus Woesearchaeota archaeon]MBT7062572.1 hypothetical protein [Candidatus Woesearchaeota archaeon]MBT7402365.1 hypothetical protein [Candidatus Woesearchaeota archaeon]
MKKTFNLTGELRLGSRWNKFSKDIAANDENHAKELLFARFGSKHKLPRRFINLLAVSDTSGTVTVNETAEDKSAVGQSTVLQAPKSNDKTTKTTE